MTRPAIEVADVVHRYGDRTASRRAYNSPLHRARFSPCSDPTAAARPRSSACFPRSFLAQQGVLRVLGYDVRRQPRTCAVGSASCFKLPASIESSRSLKTFAIKASFTDFRGSVSESRAAGTCSRGFRLSDRRDDRVETLSGGLRRRVELAKGMIPLAASCCCWTNQVPASIRARAATCGIPAAVARAGRRDRGADHAFAGRSR